MEDKLDRLSQPNDDSNTLDPNSLVMDYEPPGSINFITIKPEVFKTDQFIIQGVSEHSDYKNEQKISPMFKATCKLHVTKRYDHDPTK